MACGPKRAPGRFEVAVSKGTPQIATSTPASSLVRRRRMNELTPAKVGSWEPPRSGPVTALSIAVGLSLMPGV